VLSCYTFFIDNGILNHQQHGFICNKSSLTNMLETFEDWTKVVNQGYGVHVDVVYLNYSKAFESAPHCHKLEVYGIRGDLSVWVTNLLSNWLQRVVVNGCTSDWVSVQSGVSQDSQSVPGLLLFILYGNDIPDLIESNL